MKPCLWPSAPEPLLVGNGGDEDVSVVAKRVGLKRFEDGCHGVRSGSIWYKIIFDLPLPDDPIIAEIFQHGSLCWTYMLNRVILYTIPVNSILEKETVWTDATEFHS